MKGSAELLHTRLVDVSCVSIYVKTKAERELDLVRQSFSAEDAVAFYKRTAREVGLWPCEEIVFQKYLSKDGAILDIGCGAGRTTIGLYRRGFRNILGVDLSPRMVDAAAAFALELGIPVNFEVANVCCLAQPAESFEAAIFSCNGLMHVPSRTKRRAALSEIKRVLKPGGHFIFTTFCRDFRNTFWQKQRRLWKEGRQNSRLYEFGDVIVYNNEATNAYFHQPTLTNVKTLIRNSGLRLISVTTGGDIYHATGEVDRVGTKSTFWITEKVKARR